MIPGNGRVGKTQICWRLRDEGYDEAVPSTHGIQVSSLPLAPQEFDAPVTLKIWDFREQIPPIEHQCDAAGFVRLAGPNHHREAITSRPLLLAGAASRRVISSAVA
jgi:hypothetical protein